jgi:hypothetical protein
MLLLNDEKPRSPKVCSLSNAAEIGACAIPRSRSSINFSGNISSPTYVLKRDGYSVCLANSSKLRIEAKTLIQRMYSWRGYHTENCAVTSNPHRLTFVAATDQKLIGTVTLGLDSEEGLLADELYGEEINTFRSKGAKVCELSKFALDPQHSSKEVIAALFHLAYLYAHNVYRATDLLAEVNPRHVGSHKRMFGFRQISDMRTCPRVGAPAVLLHLGLGYVGEKISFLAGSRDPNERSLYPYCFSQQEKKISQKYPAH